MTNGQPSSTPDQGNYYKQNQSPPAGTPGTPGAPPQKKKSGALKWVFIGGCGCIVLIALLVALISGAVFMGINAGKKVAEPIITEQVQAIESGDVDAAYALCSEEFKAITDRNSYEDFVNTYKAALTAPNRSFSNVNREGDILTLSGNATTATGEVYPVKYQFIKKGETWFIYSIYIGN